MSKRKQVVTFEAVRDKIVKVRGQQVILDYAVADLYGVETLYPQREHYQTFINLRWNLAAKHTDTTDHLIIAHAITEHLPLISSDGKFDFYCNQGLDFIFNKK